MQRYKLVQTYTKQFMRLQIDIDVQEVKEQAGAKVSTPK